MKNLQKGFIVPVLLVIIALLVVGGGVYIYQSKKTEVPVVVDTETQQSNQTQQQTSQNNVTTLPQNNQQTISNKVSISGTSFGQGDKITISWPNNSGSDALLLFNANTSEQKYNISDAVSRNSYIWTIPTTIQPGTYYIQAGIPGPKLKSQNFTISASSAVNPSIVSLSPTSVPLLSGFKINGSKFDPLGGYVGNGWITNSHVFVKITNSAGQTGILWEGGSQGGNTSTANQITIPKIPAYICTISEVGAGGCPSNSKMQINLGTYTLNVSVDGRGTSNPVTLTVTQSMQSPVSILSPNGGETVDLSKPVTVSFISVDGAGTSLEMINQSTGQSYSLSALVLASTGHGIVGSGAKQSVTVSIPSSSGIVAGGNFVIKVCAVGPGICDTSDTAFATI